MASANFNSRSASIRHVLVTGPPGVGKTTLIKKVLDSLVVGNQLTVCGFLTQEVRDSTTGRRAGFDVISLQGYPRSEKKIASLARTRESCKSLPLGPNIGSYVVDVRSFESIALPSMSPGQQQETLLWPKGVLCVLDEIGKMELLSGPFKRAVEEVMNQDRTVVLATVPLVSKGKGLSLVDDLKSRSKVKLFEVTRENRDHLTAEVASLVQTCLKS